MAARKICMLSLLGVIILLISACDASITPVKHEILGKPDMVIYLPM